MSVAPDAATDVPELSKQELRRNIFNMVCLLLQRMYCISY